MLPSASSLQRVMMCTPSGVLQRVENTDNEEATDSGTALHRYLELTAYPTEPRPERWPKPEDWLTFIDEQYHADCLAIQVEKLPRLARVTKEAAYAFNAKDGVGRFLGAGLDRDYSACGPDDFPGTADVVGVDDAGGLVILDYKTGTARTTPPARENWQLRHNAVCASEHYGIDHGKLIICKTRGDLYLDSCDFGPDDLKKWKLALVSLRLRLLLKPEQMTYRTGKQCQYCPSMPVCPAQTSLVRAATRSPSLAAEELAKALTPENAREAYATMRTWENALKLLKSQIAMYARTHRLDLGNGLVYGETKTAREELDPGVAWQTLKTMYGQKIAEQCVNIDVSKAGIERGLKALAKRGELAGMVRATLGEIASNGGITVKTNVQVAEHKSEE